MWLFNVLIVLQTLIRPGSQHTTLPYLLVVQNITIPRGMCWRYWQLCITQREINFGVI